MPAPSIFEDPGFMQGFARHLERRHLECLANGLVQEAVKLAEALYLVKLLLMEMKEGSPTLVPGTPLR